MVAIVGKDFRGTLAAAPTPTIKHAPPKVRPALAETKPLVVAARKQLHFKLAAPSLLDVNSRPDTYVASRVYPAEQGPQGPAPRLQELARRRRLLGDRGERLARRAGAREPELHAADRGPDVRLLPHRARTSTWSWRTGRGTRATGS